MCKNQLPCHLHGSGDRTRNWEPGCQSVFGFIWLIYKESYPSLHSVTVVIPWPKTPEEEKNTSGFLSIVHRGGNSGQEFKQELRAETRQEHRLLVGLLLLLTQPAFLYYPGPPAGGGGMARPTVGGTLLHQSLFKKMLPLISRANLAGGGEPGRGERGTSSF